MADWSEFFYGVVAGSAVTIISMCAAVYAVWYALLAAASGYARPQQKGPWGG